MYFHDKKVAALTATAGKQGGQGQRQEAMAAGWDSQHPFTQPPGVNRQLQGARHPVHHSSDPAQFW